MLCQHACSFCCGFATHGCCSMCVPLTAFALLSTEVPDRKEKHKVVEQKRREKVGVANTARATRLDSGQSFRLC